MSRRSERALRLTMQGFLLGGLLLSACAAHVGIDAKDDRRHPDGVAVDPLDYPPDPKEGGLASEGVIALRTPLGPEAARETTKSFLVAIAHEDLETLRKLFTPDATSINPSSRARENAFYFFSRRFGKLDYTFLANVGFFQEERMELYRASEADTVWADTVGPTASPGSGTPSSMNDALDASDVVVRVPLTLPRVGASPLFGDEVTLLLRRSGGKYAIHRVVEDFTLTN